MGQEKSLVTREEMEETWGNTVIVGMLTLMAFMVILPFIQQATVMAQEAAVAAAYPRVPTYTEPLETVASNVGAMWIQMTPAGYPNELRMIAENSTGSFEDILISMST